MTRRGTGEYFSDGEQPTQTDGGIFGGSVRGFGEYIPGEAPQQPQPRQEDTGIFGRPGGVPGVTTASGRGMGEYWEGGMPGAHSYKEGIFTPMGNIERRRGANHRGVVTRLVASPLVYAYSTAGLGRAEGEKHTGGAFAAGLVFLALFGVGSWYAGKAMAPPGKELGYSVGGLALGLLGGPIGLGILGGISLYSRKR